MSALGQKQTCAVQGAMSALPPKADIVYSTHRLSAGGRNDESKISATLGFALNLYASPI
jgi:hypothetical protein